MNDVAKNHIECVEVCRSFPVANLLYSLSLWFWSMHVAACDILSPSGSGPCMLLHVI